MDISTILSWLETATTYALNQISKNVAILIALGSLIVSYFAHLTARKALKLQNNSSELARMEIEQRTKEQETTVLNLKYKDGYDASGTFILTNIGKSPATDVKMNIDADRPNFSPIPWPEYLTPDQTWFRCRDLDPSEEYQQVIHWDGGASHSEVQWTWRNADGSKGHKQLSVP